MFTIAKFIADFFDLDISKVQRWLFWIVAVLLLIVILAAGLWIRSCASKRAAKLNDAQIVAAQQAIQKQDHAAMVEILTQSDVAEKQIDGNVANAKADTVNAINEARKANEQLSNEQLAAELEKRSHE